MFCEAPSDHRTACLLIDDVLRLRSAPWVSEQLDQVPESVRVWEKSRHGAAWVDIHHVYQLADEVGISRSTGHFGGEAAQAGARMLDTIFRIIRRLNRSREPHERPEAIVVVWDMDKQRAQRQAGLAQAAQEARHLAGAHIVIGCPDPIRETWVLAGFDPINETEQKQLDVLRERLGFWPHEEPHRLTAGNENSKTHAKRVLSQELGVTTWEREESCVRITNEESLRTRRKRGAGCGLTAFLDSVCSTLVPMVGRTTHSER